MTQLTSIFFRWVFQLSSSGESEDMKMVYGNIT